MDRCGPRFVSALTHELRTPVGSILMLAELIGGTRGAQLEAAAGDLRALADEAGELARLLAGRTAVTAAPTAVEPLVDELEAAARARAGARLEVARGDDLSGSVSTDPTRLAAALDLLLQAALRAADGAPVALRFDRDGDGGGGLTIRLRDRGPSLTAAELESAFEPFQALAARTARDHGGVSLRLPLARALAERLEAGLRLEAAAGGGLAYVLSVPGTGSD